MSNLIDSHCHLTYEPLKSDVKKIIQDCKEANIDTLLSIGTTYLNSKESLDLANEYNNIYTSIGIHPHEVDEDFKNFELLKNLVCEKKVIAIGETGLDFFYNHSTKNSQITSFEKHIEFARNKKLPLIVHTRNADHDTLEIIKNEKNRYNTKFLIHCFSGDKVFCKKLLDLDCHISFSGIITFKNAANVREAAKIVPIEKILIETDSPYLAPEPMRGKVNTPKNIIYIAECLAKIKEMSLNNFSITIQKNFNKFFFNENFNNFTF